MTPTLRLLLSTLCAATLACGCADAEGEAVEPVEPFNTALQQDACGVILPTRVTATSTSAPTDSRSLASIDCNTLPLDECQREPTCAVWGGHLNKLGGEAHPVACIHRLEEPQLCAGAVTGRMDACGRCWVQSALCPTPPGSTPSQMPSCDPHP